MKYKTLIISITALVFLPFAANAATLYVAPSGGTYKTGELFSVLVNVNTLNKSINAASGQLNFDRAKLEVVSLGYSNSIFTLWTQGPAFSNSAGSVTFSGGLPSPGFTGPSGAILRITFKPKASGQAAVNFVSGSILANDGKGTNILDGFSGGVFNVIASAAKPAETPSAGKPVPSVAEEGIATQPAEAPLITEWPATIEAGQSITIKGLSVPVSRIIIAFQKGSEESVSEETFSGADGRFSHTFSKPAAGGLYRVWARTLTNDGVLSPQSSIVTIEVIQPLFFRIGTVALNYASIVVTLLSLIIFLVFVLGYAWWRFRGWQKRQGVEISEAETALHESFEAIKTGLRRYVRHLANTKSPQALKKKGEKAEEILEEDLKEIEQDIKKEIEDIKHPKKHYHDEE